MRNHLTKTFLVVCSGILLGFTQASAQSNNYSNGVDMVKVNDIRSRNAVSAEPAVKPFSLIDLSKLKWSQSYSMSFGSSSFGSSGVGMYTSSFSYEFSPKLSMQFALGLAHNLSNSGVSSNGDFFPAFALDYHPSSKFRLRIDVQRSPYSSQRGYSSRGYLSPFNSYGYGFNDGFGAYPY